MSNFNYKQVRQVVPATGTTEIQQQPTDPTRTLLTWREFSDKVGERIDQIKLNPPTTEDQLIELLAMMDEDLMDYFEDYLFLMMQKGILFASEHMNRLSPKYHFEAGWSPADDKTLANLLEGCHKYLTNWTTDIRNEAAEQIRAGGTLEEIGARVAEVVGKSRFRGTVIARTELMRAWNKAAYDRYIKAGFGEAGQIPPAHPLCRCGITVVMTATGFEIVWMTARDPRVCHICQPLDGVPIDEINLA